MSSNQDPQKKDDPHDDNTTSKSLRDHIHAAVEATNKFLATVQDTTESIRAPIVKGLHSVESGGSRVATKAMHVYERRHEFGPYLVAGSAVTVGGIVSFRRGRIPGALMGIMTGGLAYLAVYESIPLQDIDKKE